MELTLENILGKVMLIGITCYNPDNKIVDQKQIWGKVEFANSDGICVRLSTGELFKLPPDLRSTVEAQPGEYRLRSTGEVVKDPDLITTWNIRLKDNKE